MSIQDLHKCLIIRFHVHASNHFTRVSVGLISKTAADLFSDGALCFSKVLHVVVHCDNEAQ